MEKAVDPACDLKNIYRDAVREVDPAGLIVSRVRKEGRKLALTGQEAEWSEDLSSYRQVMVLGIGKASARMASAMESLLDEDLTSGFVITKYGHGLDLRKVKVHEAGHPVPDENSLKGARILTDMARAADEHTLIIHLISGGGSSLFCLPADGISLDHKRRTTQALLASGAGIDEVNCVRKHLSKVKGGGLARIASPARLINLILSDVIGDRIDTRASGIPLPESHHFRTPSIVQIRTGQRASGTGDGPSGSRGTRGEWPRRREATRFSQQRSCNPQAAIRWPAVRQETARSWIRR